MNSIKRIIGTILIAVALLSTGGCGGGGGGGGGGTASTNVDPAAYYKGVQEQAAVTQTNAEELALGGFSGGNINSNIRVNRLAADGAISPTEPTQLMRLLTDGLKNSIRRMDAAGVAKQIRKTQQEAGSGKTTRRAASNIISGRNGGSATYTIDINDATGSFAGSVTYQAYRDQSVTVDGTADIRGTFDANYQAIRLVTISFAGLSVRNGTAAVTMSGTLTWAFDLSASAETLTINTVLTDQSNSKTYWFNNYTIGTTYGSSSLSQTCSGRYFDPVHGYVDFTTQSPLITAYGNSWPNQGSIRFNGKNGTWLLMTFYPRKLTIEADTVGGGSITWQKDIPTNSQQDFNTQPVAVAGPDQNAMQMELVTLSGTASYDPDGDPLTYSWSFSSCPQGSCPGLTGANTATPTFTPNLSGSYTLNLTVFDGMAASQSDSVIVAVSPATPSSPALLQQQWQYGTFGQSIGKAGLLTTDLDSDGAPEIVASASGGGFGDNAFWYILKRNASGTYDQIWRSEQYPVTLVRLTMADCNGDGNEELIAALADGTIHVYDRATRQKLSTYSTTSPLTDLAIADLDGDGTKELIISNGTAVYVYNANSGSLKWSLSTGGGSSIAVGNVDGDSALEIVTTTFGGKGYVIDGATHAIEWEYINSFGAQVRLADLDGDGMQEIVGASAWYKITVFDADLKTPTWEITTSLDIGSLLVADADGDGIPEIIYGDGQWGKIHAIDARTRLERWAVSNPEHGVSGIALGDMDLNGNKEVLWGAGGTSTGPDHLYVAAPDTGTIAWQSSDIYGMNPVAVGDLDGDGVDELLMVTRESDSGYAEGVVHIFDARTHALKFSQKLGTMDWMRSKVSVRIGDVDGDGRAEFVVTTAYLYDGLIQVYDGVTYALKRQSQAYRSSSFGALAIGDVDGDGAFEIVAEQDASTGHYVIVFDGSSLQEKWRSTDFGGNGEGYDIKLADIDGDGHQEIIATASGSRLVVYDGVTHVLKQIIDHPARALEVADVDGDGTLDVLVGRTDGRIDVLDGKTLAVKHSVVSYSNSAINVVRLADLDGDGVAEWLVGSGSNLTVLDGSTRRLKWKSTGLANNVGFRNHLAVKDVDGDGRKDVFFGSDLTLHHFE